MAKQYSDEAKTQERRRLAKARIGDRPWMPLDNASKIFLSTMSNVDTKVFRLTAGLSSEVRPDLLQAALDSAYDSFPMYHGIIRRGIFWYFIERSTLRPVVKPETDIPCAQIYTAGYRGLLFRVLYRANRVHLEVFHALSDGSGAVSFFQLLLITYLRLCRLADNRISEAVLPFYVASDIDKDSFTEFFTEKDIVSADRVPARKLPKEKIYRIKGKKTYDGRMNILELHIRTSKLLTAAREAGGTLTTYLSAIFLKAIYETMPQPDRARRDWQLVLSVPVDLRQFYPSLTSRNFFATVMLRHVFRRGETVPVASLTEALSNELREEATKEKISAKVQRLVRFEHNLFIRLIPLYLKDYILRLINHLNNLGITASMTNLGRFRMPGEVADELQEAIILTSAARPQFSFQSYDNDLAITFTSPKMSTAIQDRYREILEEQGLVVQFAVESIIPKSDGKVYKNVTEEIEVEEASSGVGAGAASGVGVDELAAGGEVLTATQSRASAQDPPYPAIPVETNLPLAQGILTAATVGALLFYSVANLIWELNIPIAALLIGVGTAWLVVTGILRNLHNPAWSILRQALILSFAVVIIDLVFGWEGWSLTWAIPIIDFSSILATQITLLASRKALQRGVFFLQINAILTLLPLLFILLGLVSPIWPSWVAVGVGVVSFTLTAVWRRKLLGEEVRRKLHF